MDERRQARIECVDGNTFQVWNGSVLLATCPSENVAKLVLDGLSPKMDSRAAENFAAGLAQCRKAIEQHSNNCIQANGGGRDFGRATSLVLTKLDEAELWFTKATWT